MVNKMVSYTGGKRDCLGPIQLAWMVNKIALLATHRRESASPSRRAGWGRGCVAVVGLAAICFTIEASSMGSDRRQLSVSMLKSRIVR
jgi:hypothetical protein